MNQAGADAVAAMNEGADALHPPPPPQRSSTLPSSTTERQAQRRSWLGSVRGFDYWSHFGTFLVENPGRVVAIAFILLSPFIWIALAESQFTAMPTQIVPRSTPSGAVMLQLEREFGAHAPERAHALWKHSCRAHARLRACARPRTEARKGTRRALERERRAG
eukprot:4805360-Pleurochrysis_carterae.AAC.1